MKRFFVAIGRALRRFFLPPADAKTYLRILPLIVVAFLVIVLFAASNAAWEESNSPVFCGTTCHTMPPEYVSYQQSAHTNVTCEDCHMGRDSLGVMIDRKARYSWQTGTAMLLNTYHYPIQAKNMAPAREACENCHKPEKFSTDKLVELKHYAEDENNTPSSVFLAMHTGGGSSRQGLGFGIHWHIENPVYFYATDKQQQTIPYIQVKNADGTTTEYVDVQEGFNPASVDPAKLVQMDCITCHNRTAHLMDSPQKAMDDLISRGLVSVKIPEIKKKGVEVLSKSYPSEKAAMDWITVLKDYYKNQHPDFYSANASLVDSAVLAIQNMWKNNNFPDQQTNWQTHPNNLAHLDSPGCFRCHDGKHISGENRAVRLECNLCHSVPVTSGPTQLTANMQLNKGFEPDTHKNPNWISLHRSLFDETCAGCHTTDDPGGVSNTSFCSNSACHGADWKFAGFNAPKLRAVLAVEAQKMPTATPRPTATSTPTQEPTSTTAAGQPTPTPPAGPAAGSVTFASLEPVFAAKCGSCHGSNAMKGLNLTSYQAIMKGSDSGPVVIPGDAENSLIVKIQKGQHFGKLSADELAQLERWINDGAPEK